MKNLLVTLLGTFAVVSIASAAKIGGVGKIEDPDFDGYSGEYKYPVSVTYVDYRGNTVTGTSWTYVTVSTVTLSECQSQLNSATYWGATITKYCSGN